MPRQRDEVPLRLKVLAEHFERVRAGQRFARVPKELRAAALAALREGVSEGELRRSCRLSWSQLDAWKRAASSSRALAAKGVRVFSVVDEGRRVAQEAAAAEAQTLELRAGPWSVTVRFSGAEAKPGAQ